LNNGFRREIRAEIACAFDTQQFYQSDAGSIDTAFDGANRAAADIRGFFVGKPGSAHQDERLALIRVPTLVASAESDALHRYLDEMHALVPGSRRMLLKELETKAGLAEAARVYGAFLDSP